MTENGFDNKFEMLLREAIQPPLPDDQFKSRLRGQIENYKQMATISPKKREINTFFYQPVFLILLLLIISILVVSPQTVIGAIKNFIETYIPGFGLVDSENAYYLPEPVEYTEEGVTLRVEQVFIGREETFTIVHFLHFPGENYSDLDHVFLRLPDGKEIGSGGKMKNQVIYSPGDAKVNLNFSGVADASDRVTLIWRTPYGMFQKDYWEIPLRLSPLSEYETKTAAINYQPDANIASSTGLDIQISSVAENDECTAIRINISCPVEYGKPSKFIDPGEVWLEDEHGRRYEIYKNIQFGDYTDDSLEPDVINRTTGSYYTTEETIAFAPLKENPKQLILHFNNVSIYKEIVYPLWLTFDQSSSITSFRHENIPFIIADTGMDIIGADLVKTENEYYFLKLKTDPLPDIITSVDFLLFSNDGTNLDAWKESDLPKNQELRFLILKVFANLNGNWEIRWDRP